MATKPSQRLRALALYKELHRLGRDYEPSYNFHGKLRKLFEKNRSLRDETEIERALELGEYIKNETLALYSLRKYRYLKRMYPSSSTSTPDTPVSRSHQAHPSVIYPLPVVVNLDRSGPGPIL